MRSLYDVRSRRHFNESTYAVKWILPIHSGIGPFRHGLLSARLDLLDLVYSTMIL